MNGVLKTLLTCPQINLRTCVNILTSETKTIRRRSLAIFDLCCLHEWANVFEVWILQCLKEDSVLKGVTFFITVLDKNL